MKKKSILLLLAVTVSLLFTACPIVDNPSFDESLMIGKWNNSGTQLYEKYFSDYTGSTWDESEVLEEDAQPFTWSLEGDALTQIHIMEMGGVVPKTYTVTELTDSTFKYHDSYSKSYNYVKVQ
ncbi:MAG: lipocalin family protein [Bacteroidales bacterium]|nr:lipocalin family protein [Bacteroidales bacterium]